MKATFPKRGAALHCRSPGLFPVSLRLPRIQSSEIPAAFLER
jgi:hypothetical protein